MRATTKTHTIALFMPQGQSSLSRSPRSTLSSPSITRLLSITTHSSQSATFPPPMRALLFPSTPRPRLYPTITRPSFITSQLFIRPSTTKKFTSSLSPLITLLLYTSQSFMRLSSTMTQSPLFTTLSPLMSSLQSLHTPLSSTQLSSTQLSHPPPSLPTQLLPITPLSTLPSSLTQLSMMLMSSVSTPLFTPFITPPPSSTTTRPKKRLKTKLRITTRSFTQLPTATTTLSTPHHTISMTRMPSRLMMTTTSSDPTSLFTTICQPVTFTTT